MTEVSPYKPPAGASATKVSIASRTHSGETSTWCPGCGHGSLTQLMADVIDELGIQDRVILSIGVGCGSSIMQQLNVHAVGTPHGRASDAATGLSRMLPERIVVQYSGDGDACAIGLSGLIHACNRRENFLVFIYNNNVYGMTGGQIGPTTCEVVPTTTFQHGRPEEVMGYPMDIVKMIAPLPGVVYAARCATSSGKHLVQARRMIKRAFRMHMDGVKGMKVLDVMGNCNVNWKGATRTYTPQSANELIENEILKYFEVGEFDGPV